MDLTNTKRTLTDSGKFTIPALKPKTPNNSSLKLGGTSYTDLGKRPSNINQFLLKQLESKDVNGQHTVDRFSVPKLVKGSTSGFVKPELKTVPSTSSEILNDKPTKTQETTKTISQIDDNDHIIDLTTALSYTRITSSGGNNDNNNGTNESKTTKPETFEIPFIECDRRQQLPHTDNYCLIDISDMQFQHKLASPSTLGRILSTKMRKCPSSEIPKQKLLFKARHRIDRFLFDTKSPDDIVLASLNRFTRT